jgi:hypothetical protein
MKLVIEYDIILLINNNCNKIKILLTMFGDFSVLSLFIFIVFSLRLFFCSMTFKYVSMCLYCVPNALREQ